APQVRVVVVEPLVNRAVGAVAKVVVGAAGEVVAAAEPHAIAQVIRRRAEVRPGVTAAGGGVSPPGRAGVADEGQAEDKGTDTKQDLIHRLFLRVGGRWSGSGRGVGRGGLSSLFPGPFTPDRRNPGTDLRGANSTRLLF